eukprot:94022-Rhodomonas_salina.1
MPGIIAYQHPTSYVHWGLQTTRYLPGAHSMCHNAYLRFRMWDDEATLQRQVDLAAVWPLSVPDIVWRMQKIAGYLVLCLGRPIGVLDGNF